MAKILITEDYEDTRGILITCMEMWGHEVVGVASTLSAALLEARAADKKEVQVAIVDGNLGSGAPETKDGEAVAAVLRECAPNVRIIAHTAQKKGDYGDIFLQKPFNPKDMKSAIEKALAMSSKT